MKSKTASKQISQVSLNLAEFDPYATKRSPSHQPGPQTVRAQLPPLGIKLAKVDWSDVMKHHSEHSASVDLDPVRASFFCDKAVEEAKTDLSRLYYNESTKEKHHSSPVQVHRSRKLKAVSVNTSFDEKQMGGLSQGVSPVKMGSVNVRLGLTEVVDEMERRVIEVRRTAQGLDCLELELHELTDATASLESRLSPSKSERIEILLRLLSSYKSLLASTLQQYRQDKTAWKLHSADRELQRPVAESETPFRFDPVDQRIRQVEAKRKLDELEKFMSADNEAYEKLKNSIFTLMQTTSSGTMDCLNSLYKDMTRTRTMPDNLPLQLPNLRLTEWEGELKSRFR